MSDATITEIDARMSEVFMAWFEMGHDTDLPTGIRDDIYVMLRFAFALGRDDMKNEILPLVERNLQAVKEVIPFIEALSVEG